MPVSRLTAEALSGDVAAHYGHAEVRLLQLIAKHLSAGTDSPRWADEKLAELQMFRKRAGRIVGQATAAAVGDSTRATEAAYLRGAAAAQGDVERAGITLDTPPLQAERAVEALTRAQTGTLEAIGPRVVRQTEDAYRDAVVRASAGTLTGASTRVQDAQEALDDLARKGITGFTDKAGRQWGIESYVEMATRTTTGQAAVVGHLDRLDQAGIPLVVVSTSSRECERCRPWEGKVLSRGPVDVMQRNVLTGRMERVSVDGTVQQAISAGLMHPNCTHNLSGYIHGATPLDRATPNPKGYAEKQQQRAMERNLRHWKRRQAVAVTPEAKRKADAKVRDWQKRIRDHVDATGLPRKPRRESLDVTPLQVKAPRELPLRDMDTELIESELAETMAAGDYGPRYEALANELDRRDAEGTPAPQTLPAAPDPMAEREAMERLLFGSTNAERDAARAAADGKPVKRDVEKELREEYDTWLHTQWLRAEDETRGVMLTKRAEHDGVNISDLFTGRLSLKHASPELQEWFAQPGNQRLSYPEFRAGRLDDKKARQARQRLKGRGFESEYG